MSRIIASRQAAVIWGSLMACVGSNHAFAKEDAAAPGTLQAAIGDPDDLKVSGSVRVRYEALDNQFRPNLDRSSDIVLLRTTLSAEYGSGPVRLGGEVMDSRAYATNAGGSAGTGEVNAMELVQAYLAFDLGDALGRGSNTSFQAGRFTMDLGSRRLVARNNFRNTTNAFTGFKAQYQSAAGMNLTAFYTLPLMRLPSGQADILDNKVEWDRESFDLTFWGGLLSAPLAHNGPTIEAYFYGLDEKDSPQMATRNRKLYTPGLRLIRKPRKGALDYEFEGAYQFGTIRASTAASAAKMDVSAYFVHAAVGYRFDAPWNPRVSLEYDRASGDGSGAAYGRFDTLFGARRFDFGPTSIFGALGRANVSSPGVRLEVAPDKRWDGFVMYRAAWLDSATDSFSATAVRDTTGASGTFGGQQIEAQVRYWVLPGRLRLETGAATFINGHFLKNAPNASGNGDPLYGYAAATATF